MLQNHNRLRLLTQTALALVLMLGFILPAPAQDKKVDPAGNWTWTRPGRNGGPEQKMTLKLKMEGDKLTGKLAAPGRGGQERETDIKDAKVKGDELSFTLVREVNGTTMTSKYNGKISGDTIKGKIEFERDGQAQTRDWEAKRSTEKK
jgi:hypothetical protein